jgi:hypothetical protein
MMRSPLLREERMRGSSAFLSPFPVMISASAVDNAPSDCKVQYSDDNKQTWHDYIKGTLLQYNSINDTPIIYAKVVDISGKYLDSDIVSDQVKYNTLPNPSVIFRDSRFFFD